MLCYFKHSAQCSISRKSHKGLRTFVVQNEVIPSRMGEFSTTRLGCSSCLIKLTIYLALRGLSKEVALMNCQELKLKVTSNQSGIYRIVPHSGSHDNAFQAYCDSQTDGGVWTSVWRCTFRAFRSTANAVKPRPSWSASGDNTSVYNNSTE